MREYTYKAFISYRHTRLDKKVAEKLQKMLETYKAPRGLSDTKENWRIFRDESELPTSSNLGDDIKSALEESEFLIVLCSKTTARSKWCLEEITQFKALHGGTNENIITLLVDGEPSKVFPEELCRTVERYTAADGGTSFREVSVEPLAANISADSEKKTLKKLHSEFLRIAAPLLGCGYDDLFNRNHRRKVKRLAVGAAIAFTAVTMFGVYSSAMLMRINEQKNQLQIKNEELEAKTIEINTSNENLEQANSELDTANSELDQKNKELDETNTNLDKVNSALETKNAELDTANSNLTKTNTELDTANSNLTKTNTELNTSNKNLDMANSELQQSNENLDKTNSALTKSNDDLADKTKEAQDNLEEANKQRDAAEANLKEAERQRSMAEENLSYAEEQKAIAEENLMVIKGKNQELRISAASMAAKTAETELKNNDRNGAIRTILDNRPYEDDDTRLLPSGMNILSKAVYAYQSTSAPQIDRVLEARSKIVYCEYSPDTTKVLAYDDEGFIYVWDTDSGKLIYNDEETERIELVKFISDNSIIKVTSKNVSAINCEDASIYWSKVSGDIMDDKYIYSAEISESAKTLVVENHEEIAFIDTGTGEVIYRAERNLQSGESSGKGGFFGDTGYILSCYTSEDNGYHTRFIRFDIENKSYEQLPYETDMYVQALLYFTPNAFSAEGYIYNENGGLTHVVNTVKISGEEVYSVKLDDFWTMSDDLIFQMVFSEDNSLFVLVANNDLILLDILSGEIYYREELESNIRNVYQGENGKLIVLYKNGAYVMDIDKKYIASVSFADSEPDASSFFLWGGYTRFVTVGVNTGNIVLYRTQTDENYTAKIDMYSTIRSLTISEKYFAITDGDKIYVYNAVNKDKLSEIPYSHEEFCFWNDTLIQKNKQTLTWYDVTTGEIVKTADTEGINTMTELKDDKGIIACGSSGIRRITDDIQTIFTTENDKEFISSPYYVSTAGTKVVTQIKNYTNKVYKLTAIDTQTGEQTVLDEEKEPVFSDEKSAIGAGKFAWYYDNTIRVYDLDNGALESEIPLDNIVVKKMIFDDGDKDIIIYSGTDMIYEYNTESGELINSVLLERDKNEWSSYLITMEIDSERDTLIISRDSRAWFIDLSSFDVAMEFPANTYYAGFLNSTQEIVASKGDVTRFYPYYTSEQLIEMAERLTGNWERKR